jgi:hypothetical protein
MARNLGLFFVVLQERDLFTFYVMNKNREVVVYGNYFAEYEDAYYNAVDAIAQVK